MRVYFEVARRTFRRMTTYRGATVAGVFTNTAFGFLLAYVLLAVYAERPEVGGFDPADAVTFTFVVQGMLMVVGIFGDLEIAERVRTGDVVSDLARPVDYQAWWGAVAYGKAAFYAVFRGIPPFLVGAIVFDLRVPGAAVWPWFVASAAVAVAVAYGWRFLLNLCAFWILDVRGPNQLGSLAAQFLSGAYVPIVFFPLWLADAARVLPFASMMQLPVEVFLGKHTGGDVAGVLVLQLFWAVVLLALGRLVFARAVHRVVVHGG